MSHRNIRLYFLDMRNYQFSLYWWGMHLNGLVSWLFSPKLTQVSNKENIKAPHYWEGILPVTTGFSSQKPLIRRFNVVFLFHCTNCWEKSWVAGEMRRDLSYWFDGGSTHWKLHSEVINYVTCTLRCPKSPATRLLSNNLFRLTYRKSLKLCISGLDWSLSAHYALTYFF